MSASPVPPGAPLELDAIEARANAATDAPWDLVPEQRGRRDVDVIICAAFEDEAPGICGPHSSSWPLTAEDAAFIAAARTDVPALCAEVRRLRAALEEVRARDAEIARLRELFAEPHFMGAPAMAGGGFDESVVMVSRAWYTRLAALAPTGEPGNE